ncbi:MAG: hypothetical protein NTV65_11305 [Proteobacteria bacterium]|nr:hypothetical protein [Pseudomonadota bacterium]
MEHLGREYSLHFHGLETGTTEVREQFRMICLEQLELTNQQALDILTSRATTVICSDLSPESLRTATQHLNEIGVRVDIAKPSDYKTSDYETLLILSASFSRESDAIFAESPLYEDPRPIYEPRRRRYEDYASGCVEEFFSTAQYCPYPQVIEGTALIDNSARRGIPERRGRHTSFLRRQRALSRTERAGLAFVACALVALFVIFATRPAPALLTPQSAPEVNSQSRATSLESSTTNAQRDEFEGTIIKHNYSITIRSNINANSASMRLFISNPKLAVPANSSAPNTDAITFIRGESDPIFMLQNTSGVWQGESPLYILVDHNGEQKRLSGLSTFKLSMSTDGQNGEVLVTVAYPREQPVSAAANGNDPLVSISETIKIESTTKSAP